MTTPDQPADPRPADGTAVSGAVPAMRKSLLYGAVFTVVLAIGASVVGALVAELPGLLSGLIGALMGFVFLGLTAASILLADRVTRGDLLSPAYFGIVLGAWLLKFLIFLVLIFVLGDVPALDRIVLFLTLVVAVLGGLVTDLLGVARARVPYVDAPRAPRP
ncbi:hypothetical protein OVN18_10305 [Microcella daejeonensis]|uniref:ATP synthase protein I n=1 Tax=Microcella daejeonensis TaxID=2994971 RepID=A0A9E8S8Z5_9MICO|nr:hypothetical protein [Microcella daejeonensis]WAB80946.1 hypothetical protein OVN18_10305 [Microcella daejeonensis]